MTEWDISTAVWLQLKSVSTEESSPTGLFFKPDGTKMYIIGLSGVDVNEYDLSVAWDVTSAVWLQLFDVSTEESSPTGLFFKPDGTKMYIIGYSGDEVNEYDLSVAWDITSAVWLQLFDVSDETITPVGLFFKPDGTKMYTVGSAGIEVNEYDLSVAWDVTSAVWLQLFDVSDKEINPQDVFFKPDGTKMYIVGYDDNVNEYDLSVAWDVTSAVWLQLFDVSDEENFPTGLFFKPDGTKMYVIGAAGDDVNEYDLPAAPEDINPKVKIAGTFETKTTSVKIAGTFEEKPVMVKVGGVFQ